MIDASNVSKAEEKETPVRHDMIRLMCYYYYYYCETLVNHIYLQNDSKVSRI